MSKNEDVLAKAVRRAVDILASYVEPGPRDCNATINRLLSAIDNEAVAQALTENEEKQDGRRPDKKGTARQNSHQHH